MVHDQETNLDLLSCCAIPVWWTSAVSNIDLKYGTLYSSLDIWKVPCLRWSVLNHCLPATPKGLRSPDVSFLVLLSRSSMRPTRTIWQTKLIFSRFRSSLPRSCIATTNHTSSHYTKKIWSTWPSPVLKRRAKECFWKQKIRICWRLSAKIKCLVNTMCFISSLAGWGWEWLIHWLDLFQSE